MNDCLISPCKRCAGIVFVAACPDGKVRPCYEAELLELIRDGYSITWCEMDFFKRSKFGHEPDCPYRN